MSQENAQGMMLTAPVTSAAATVALAADTIGPLGVTLARSDDLLAAAREALACGRVEDAIKYLALSHTTIADMASFVDRADECLFSNPIPLLLPSSVSQSSKSDSQSA